MISTRELAKLAKVSEQTVRNYTRDYGALLSPAARGETGPRLFSDEDVQVFCTIATLRKEGVPPDQIAERVRRGDVYIEVASGPQQPTTSHTTPQEAHSDDLLLPVALSSLQAQMDALRADFRALQANQQRVLDAERQWGRIQGAIAALAAASAFVWLLYALGG